jgi:aromatic-amino-acid transaminase
MSSLPSSNEFNVSPLTRALFSQVQEAPPDAILGLNQACAKDKNPKRQNLGPGVYMDAEGLTKPLPSVLKAEARLIARERREGYLPIDGNPIFNRAAQELVFGKESAFVRAGHVATVQSPGGTGAVSLAAHLLKRIAPTAHALISDPTWPNHRGIFSEVGFPVQAYPYYDAKSRSVRFDELVQFLKAQPQRSIVVLHASCHNPTGYDFSSAQWSELCKLFAGSSHIPVIDSAYQGFKVGLEEDAAPIRLFAEAGIPCLVATSFSKSFSLYSQRVGALHVVTNSSLETERVLSQLKQIVRAIYSNPPAQGAHLVAEVLSDAALRSEWEQELKTMRERISLMRTDFVAEMKKRGHDFCHVAEQFGMFSYTGLSPAQVEQLMSRYSIYLMSTGRVSIPALNKGNMGYICDAIADVSR